MQLPTRAYIMQLLEDIRLSIDNASFPFAENPVSLYDFLTPEEEEATAPIRNLSEWTGITPEMLPPSEMLEDHEINVLVTELTRMLEAYNCNFVLQTEVPVRLQYETIRQNICQEVKVKQWNMGFFEMCKPGTEHKTCALRDYCQCAFYKEIFKDMIHEELTNEEERKRQLDIEVNHIKRKYGDDWLKYYPYHLDENYDDENGNPHNYGFDDSDDEDDQWWRR
jgi:hypothetical protein